MSDKTASGTSDDCPICGHCVMDCCVDVAGACDRNDLHPAACDQRAYAVNDTDYMPCNAPAIHEVFDIDGQWHPRCKPHVPIFARVEDEATRLRVIV